MHALLYQLIRRKNCVANNSIFLALIQKSIYVLENDLTYINEVIEGTIDKYLNVFLNLDLYKWKNNIQIQ